MKTLLSGGRNGIPNLGFRKAVFNAGPKEAKMRLSEALRCIKSYTKYDLRDGWPIKFTA